MACPRASSLSPHPGERLSPRGLARVGVPWEGICGVGCTAASQVQVWLGHGWRAQHPGLRAGLASPGEPAGAQSKASVPEGPVDGKSSENTSKTDTGRGEEAAGNLPWDPAGPPPPVEWGSWWTWPGRRGRGGPPPVVEAHGAGAGVGVPSFLSNSSLMTLRGSLNGHVLETPGPVLPSCADPLSIAPQDSPETRTRPVPWHPGSPSVLTSGRAGWTHRPCRRAS